MRELQALIASARAPETSPPRLTSPFDYISAEMIRTDEEFAALFSEECPWLQRCRNLEPIYLYGPRGCGKSSVLRWLAFKTLVRDPERFDIEKHREIGVYISCSVELRSRFWLLPETEIERLQVPIVRFFNLLLLEELFETLQLIWELQERDVLRAGLTELAVREFTEWCLQRLGISVPLAHPRVQGQSYFDYLKGLTRRSKWETWAAIQRGRDPVDNADPSLAIDVCRQLAEAFSFFASRHVTFLVDDYSNQRIPSVLQRKLNQTISFAKQGTPIFKVSSEFQGVDLEGIQQGREVVEVNVGQEYSSMADSAHGAAFLVDIANLRLDKADYRGRIDDILGSSSYEGRPMHRALVEDGGKFSYHGVDCIHSLCSGDLALALDLVRRIFEDHGVTRHTTSAVSPSGQHKTIQQFAHQEVRRIRTIPLYGDTMHDIVCYLGALSRAVLVNKKSKRTDRPDDPMCKTHIDIRSLVLSSLKDDYPDLSDLFDVLTSRAILFSLMDSRSRISGSTERLQLRRIYLPAFKAPLKRDVPIKIDAVEDLKSLLSNPRTFAERELSKSGLDFEQLTLAIEEAEVRPKDYA